MKNSDDTTLALQAIEMERGRQNELKAAGRFKYTCADLEPSESEKLAILTEELGEVAHEVNETIGGHRALDRYALRKELIQVAAVACAWIESLS